MAVALVLLPDAPSSGGQADDRLRGLGLLSATAAVFRAELTALIIPLAFMLLKQGLSWRRLAIAGATYTLPLLSVSASLRRRMELSTYSPRCRHRFTSLATTAALGRAAGSRLQRLTRQELSVGCPSIHTASIDERVNEQHRPLPSTPTSSHSCLVCFSSGFPSRFTPAGSTHLLSSSSLLLSPSSRCSAYSVIKSGALSFTSSRSST